MPKSVKMPPSSRSELKMNRRTTRTTTSEQTARGAEPGEHREILQRRDGETGDEVEVQPDQLVERIVRDAGVPLLVLHADFGRVAREKL